MSWITELQNKLDLSPALAGHLSRLLMENYVNLPRMEAYRLRRALRKNNTVVMCKYGEGYYLLPEDKEVYRKWFKVP